MLDQNDVPALPPMPEQKKRGRPTTGAAKTARQRKQVQRAKDKRLVTNAIGDELAATEKALIALLQTSEHAAHRAWLALGILKGWIDNARKDAAELFNATVTLN